MRVFVDLLRKRSGFHIMAMVREGLVLVKER